MIQYLTQSDADLLREKIRAKKAEKTELGHKLGDAMSRSGSFPASNPEYAAVHLEIKNLQNNIDSLKTVLNKYSVADPTKINDKAINTYSRVTLKEENNDEQICYYIALAELEKEISGDCYLATPESPVGQALLGHKLGDEVEVVLPIGTKKYKITEHVKVY